MKWIIWFGSVAARQLPIEKLELIAVEIWTSVFKRIPHEQRIDFLKNVAERNLDIVLSDLTRTERASLMNALLPLIAREFPLAELDFLKAFPFSKEG